MKNILFVEDDKATVLVIKDNLSAAGFNVVVAEDGETGYKLALEKKPDLILLNILLPKMSGLAVLKKIREDSGWGKNVPVIILTNLSSPTVISEAIEFIGDRGEYVVKVDCKVEDLVERIKERLGIRE